MYSIDISIYGFRAPYQFYNYSVYLPFFTYYYLYMNRKHFALILYIIYYEEIYHFLEKYINFVKDLKTIFY